ncbi:MAG: hypothetical protein KDJ16_09005 [Hyphomicrobiales bacterium]|nr:hypothetical protein [Hyphomicrobiales bacterium]
MTGELFAVTARTLLAALVSTTMLAGCSGGLGPSQAVGTYSAADDSDVTTADNRVAADDRIAATDQADGAPRVLSARAVSQAKVDSEKKSADSADSTEKVAEAECVPRGRGSATAYAGPETASSSTGSTWDGYPNINVLPTDNRCEFLSDKDREALKADLEDLSAAHAAARARSPNGAATEAELRELAAQQQQKAAANAAKQ